MSQQPDAAIAGVLQEISDADARPALEAEVMRLHSASEAGWERSVADWTESVANRGEVARMRNAFNRLKAEWMASDQDVRSYDADNGITSERRGELIQARTQRRDEAVERIRAEDLDGVGDEFVAGYDMPPLPAPSATVAAEAQLVYASFPARMAADFLDEAVRVLRQAQRAQGAERSRLVALIQRAYLPLARRRATAPEKHALPFRDAYDVLATAMGRFVATVEGAAAKEAAQRAVDEARGDFRQAAGLARHAGRWVDDVIRLATGR